MSTLSNAEVEQAAESLHQAETSGQQIGILTLTHPRMDMDDAYAVQSALVARKRAAGHRAIGWKIGLTSKAMQAALNIDIPDSGVLFDDMRFEHQGTVPPGRFIQPRIEAEIAFYLSKDLQGDVNRDDVIAATEYVSPALEILDTRILRRDPSTGSTRKIFDTIADNAANAGIVVGAERHAAESIDLRWVGAIVSRDNEVEETGLGAGVLNDPALGIVWLARRLAHYGECLRAGEVVISGSFIRPIEATPGCAIEGDFGDFGRVEITFD